jgi:ABC-type multidrug transport system fused ATPase/permease subunit
MRFIDQNPSGKLMSTLENETYAASDAVDMVIDLVIKVFTVMILAVFLLLISWKLTILVITGTTSHLPANRDCVRSGFRRSHFPVSRSKEKIP